jgi:hypothetical protein
MKTVRILLALLFFLGPIAVRGAWFYQGVYQRSQPVATPDFTSLKAPEPPVSSAAAPANKTPNLLTGDARAPIVLFDQAHGNLYEPLEMAPLTQAIQEQGAQVVMYDGSLALEDQLKRSSALVVIAPGSPYSAGEVQVVANFVAHGGRLLVLTDPTRSGGFDYATGLTVASAHIANQLLAPYQITFVDDYAYNLIDNEANFRNLLISQFASSPLTGGLNQVVLYSAQSLKSETVLLTGGTNTFSSLTDQGKNLPLAAMDADGKVLAIGDLTFLTLPYVQVSDNQQFTRNIAAFLAGGENPPRLANFPILFSRPVAVLVDSETALSASQVQVISGLQSGLQATLNLPVSLTSTPEDGFDLIVTGTFDSLDAIDSFLKDENLTFEAEEGSLEDLSAFFPTPDTASSEAVEATATPEYDFSSLFGDLSSEEDVEAIGTLTIPDLGKFKTQGVGVIIFHAEADRNVLILLAGSQNSLASLSARLSAGSLTGCLQTEHLAVCPLE